MGGPNNRNVRFNNNNQYQNNNNSHNNNNYNNNNNNNNRGPRQAQQDHDNDGRNGRNRPPPLTFTGRKAKGQYPVRLNSDGTVIRLNELGGDHQYLTGDVLMDTPVGVDTPLVRRYAHRKAKEHGISHAWRRMLQPLTESNPLSELAESVLDTHFSIPFEHRPYALNFRGLEVKDYARYRDETKCFVCAALADRIATKGAEDIARFLRPSPRPTITQFQLNHEMAAFLAKAQHLNQFLLEISAACLNKDTDLLQRKLARPDQVNSEDGQVLEAIREELLMFCPANNEGWLTESLRTLTYAGWITVMPVVLDYLRLIRDWTPGETPQKMADLKKMIEDAIVALGDSTHGFLILPTVLELSRFLALVACKYAAALSRSTNANANDSQAATKHAKFLEDCANSLREAFIKCLVGGASGSTAHSSPPDGKRVGIYITSNSCLRLLFQCRKLRNAQQMFVSIDAQSPFLDFYPRAQRVTYLYYLGAYYFANNHFRRAQLTLQAGYNLTHRQDFPHRRQILVYLIASNICLGRFPSTVLLSRPEALTLAEPFTALTTLIARGDLGAFRAHLSLPSPSARWFLHHRLLLQLRNRGEVLVWRALIRKTFRLAAFQPAGERMVPYLRLPYVQTAARFSLSRARATTDSSSRMLTKRGTFSFTTPQLQQQQQPTPPAESDSEETDYIDPDLQHIATAITDTGFDLSTGIYDDARIGQPPSSSDLNSFHEEEDGKEEENENGAPSIAEIESIIASLIQQGLLRGFLTHGDRPRFAVPGAAGKGGPVVHGFPKIWEVLMSTWEEDGWEKVPGWVRREDDVKSGRTGVGGGIFGGFGGGGGRVVNLSGARPAGAGP